MSSTAKRKSEWYLPDRVAWGVALQSAQRKAWWAGSLLEPRCSLLQGPPDTLVKSVLFPSFADASTRKLKFGRDTALAIPRPAPNCPCRCEETRNQDT